MFYPRIFVETKNDNEFYFAFIITNLPCFNSVDAIEIIIWILLNNYSIN